MSIKNKCETEFILIKKSNKLSVSKELNTSLLISLTRSYFLRNLVSQEKIMLQKCQIPHYDWQPEILHKWI